MDLHLVCSKCTRAANLRVTTVDAGRRLVARMGWIARRDLTICPRCPQSAAEKATAKAIAEAPVSQEELAAAATNYRRNHLLAV